MATAVYSTPGMFIFDCNGKTSVVARIWGAGGNGGVGAGGAGAGFCSVPISPMSTSKFIKIVIGAGGAGDRTEVFNIDDGEEGYYAAVEAGGNNGGIAGAVDDGGIGTVSVQHTGADPIDLTGGGGGGSAGDAADDVGGTPDGGDGGGENENGESPGGGGGKGSTTGGNGRVEITYMSNLTITDTSVLNVSCRTGTKRASAAITAGQPLYSDASATVALADNNATGKYDVVGISLDNAGTGQPVVYAKSGGSITVNAVLTAGQEYYLSDTAGRICDLAGVTSGMRKVRLGYATTTTNLVLDIKDYGISL